MFVRISIILFLSLGSLLAIATEDPKQTPQQVITYHQLKPDITTNLDISLPIKRTNEDSQLYTLTVRVNLMTDSEQDAKAIVENEALLKDKVILFINKQSMESLKTRRQKMQFKRTLKNILNEALLAELKRPDIIKKLLFTQMIFD